MESKHKNVLIGALLAVVFVMAVGYAAFATTLTILEILTIKDKAIATLLIVKNSPNLYCINNLLLFCPKSIMA